MRARPATDLAPYAPVGAAVLGPIKATQERAPSWAPPVYRPPAAGRALPSNPPKEFRDCDRRARPAR